MRELLTDLISINDTVDELTAVSILSPEKASVDVGMTTNLVRVKDVIRRLVLPTIPPDAPAERKMHSDFYRILGSKENPEKKAENLLQMQKELKGPVGLIGHRKASHRKEKE